MPTSPPITVGELTDVPAPNSPINAAYMQEVADRIIHRFTTVAAMNAWAAANGAMAYSADTGKHYLRRAGAWWPLVYEGSPGSVPTAALVDGSVTTPKLADGSVTSAKIADGTIQPGDLAASVLSGDTVALSPTGGGSNFTGTVGWFKKLGNMVFFHMQAQTTGVEGIDIYSPIPAGMAPTFQHAFAGCALNNGVGWGFYTDVSAGVIRGFNPLVGVPAGWTFVFDAAWRCA